MRPADTADLLYDMVGAPHREQAVQPSMIEPPKRFVADFGRDDAMSEIGRGHRR